MDETKLQVQDRERLEGKLADAYRWLENDGLKALGENRFEEIFVFLCFISKLEKLGLESYACTLRRFGHLPELVRTGSRLQSCFVLVFKHSLQSIAVPYSLPGWKARVRCKAEGIAGCDEH